MCRTITGKIRVAYRSKYNRKREKQVSLLMITDGNKRHYLAGSKLSALLAKKSPNHDGDLYCLNCFNSNTTKIDSENMKKYVIITIAVV